MKRTFEFNDEKSSKFWSIDLKGSEFTIIFGKVGTNGQSQTKQFADEATCKKEAEKLILSKTKKGYVENGTEVSAKPEKEAVAKEVSTKQKPVQATKEVAPKSSKKAEEPAPQKAEPGTRTFVFQNVDSHKFWDIKQEGVKVIISYGKYGAAKPRIDTKTLENEEKAAKEMKKQIRKKTGEGYMETTEGSLPLPDISHLLVKREYPLPTEYIYIDGYEYDSIERIQKKLKDDVEWQFERKVYTEKPGQEMIDEMAAVIRQNFDDKHEIVRLANELAEQNEERTNPKPIKVKVPFELPKNGKVTKKLLKEIATAIEEGDVEIVKAAIDFGITGNDKHNDTSLFYSALRNIEMIKLLTPTLSSYMQDDRDFHINHHLSFAQIIFSYDKEIINAVLDAGYDLKKDPYIFEHIGFVQDIATVERILSIIPLENDNGEAMISAIGRSNIPLVNYLLEHNARLDGMEYRSGNFVMHLALLHFYKENLDVVRKLLAAGADMYAVSLGDLDWYDSSKPRTGGGATPMSAFVEGVGRYGAMTPEIEELFKEYEKEATFTPEQAFKAARESQYYILEKYLMNGDVNIRDENGATLLHHILLQQSNTDTEKMLRQVVKKGIDINAKDNKGRNALFYLDIHTCYLGKLTAVEYLKKEGIELNCIDDEGLSPIMFHAIQRPEHPDTEKRNSEQHQHDTIYSGRATALNFLTRAGANLNLRFPDGKTIFHHILTLPTFYDDDEIIAKMMKNGGDVNLMDEHGRVPLHYCISKEYVGMDDRIDEYVKKGKANLNAQDKEGNTPIHYLILNKSRNAIDCLLRHGANPTIPNNEGKTAEDLMKEKGILDYYDNLLAEFHKAPPQTRKIEHIWNPVEVVGKDNNEPIKKLEIYGSLVLQGHNTGDHVLTAGKNRILCSDLHGRYTCIDSLTGKTIWEESSYAGHAHSLYHPENDLIYSGYDNRSVVATNPATGETVWSVHIAFSYDTFSSSFSQHGNLLLFHSKSSAYAINKETKKMQWKVKFSGDLERYESVIWKNYYIVQLDKANKAIFNLINMETGEVERTIEQEKGFKSRYGKGLVVDNDLWYISDDGSMCRVDLESGQMKDMVLTTEYIHDSKKIFIHGFFYINEKFYFRLSLIHHDGSEDGFYECDKKMNVKKILPYTEMFENSYVKGDTLYFISQHNHTISALSLTNKTIREMEFPRFSGLDIIDSYPHINNGTLFITQLGGNENQDKQILYAIR